MSTGSSSIATSDDGSDTNTISNARTRRLLFEVVKEIKWTLWVSPTFKELRTELADATSKREFSHGLHLVQSISARAEMSFVAKLIEEADLPISDLLKVVQTLKADAHLLDSIQLENACDILLANLDRD